MIFIIIVYVLYTHSHGGEQTHCTSKAVRQILNNIRYDKIYDIFREKKSIT